MFNRMTWDVGCPRHGKAGTSAPSPPATLALGALPRSSEFGCSFHEIVTHTHTKIAISLGFYVVFLGRQAARRGKGVTMAHATVHLAGLGRACIPAFVPPVPGSRALSCHRDSHLQSHHPPRTSFSVLAAGGGARALALARGTGIGICIMSCRSESGPWPGWAWGAQRSAPR
jgi:hypothetical protein